MTTAVIVIAGFLVGFQIWILAEYLLHRFAMHELHGKGIMSREHLNHHVAAGWTFSHLHLLSWAGMLLVGWLAWFPLGWVTVGVPFGLSLAVGWSVGYFFYEYEHAMSHLRAPRTAYQRRLRTRHFHHHFGHPRSNHGVTLAIWDRVFGTLEEPEQVRVPRRMAQPWMLDDDGELRPEHRDDYVLVGTRRTSVDADGDAADRVAAFASIAPAD
jgi:sterol desaturase/sphingolipid hydroxylase (fatty acid hydroxylase superfamily)